MKWYRTKNNGGNSPTLTIQSQMAIGAANNYSPETERIIEAAVGIVNEVGDRCSLSNHHVVVESETARRLRQYEEDMLAEGFRKNATGSWVYVGDDDRRAAALDDYEDEVSPEEALERELALDPQD